LLFSNSTWYRYVTAGGQVDYKLLVRRISKGTHVTEFRREFNRTIQLYAVGLNKFANPVQLTHCLKAPGDPTLEPIK
jgi:hypothetical protein